MWFLAGILLLIGGAGMIERSLILGLITVFAGSVCIGLAFRGRRNR